MQVVRWREQTPPISLPEGEARWRGGGNIDATTTPPPEYDGLEGCAALGGVSTRDSPRDLTTIDITSLQETMYRNFFKQPFICSFDN